MMSKRSSKQDINELAISIIDKANGGESEVEESGECTPETTEDGKNAAAVALGRLGGKKGGPARAKKLSRKRRSEIARKAAESRWKRTSND